MFCIFCFIYVAAVLLLFAGSVVFPFIKMPFLIVPLILLFVAFVLYICYHTLRSFCAVEVHRADDAAWLLFNKNKGRTPDLPDKLRGVFWFSTNAAPELLMSIDGAYHNRERHSLKLDSGGVYNWTYSTGLVGWLYWFMLRGSYMFCAELHIDFEDEAYTYARMPLYSLGCCPNSFFVDGCWTPMCMWWELRQIDENTWDRPITLYCWPWSKWETGSYVLKRIIDHDGNKLPAFDEMMESVEQGIKIKGINKKPVMQIMNGDDWEGNVFFPGSTQRAAHRD